MKKIIIAFVIIFCSILFSRTLLALDCTNYRIEIKYIVLCPGESSACADLYYDSQNEVCPGVGTACWKSITYIYNSIIGTVSKDCGDHEGFYKISSTLGDIKYTVKLDGQSEFSFFHNAYNHTCDWKDWVYVVDCDEYPELQSLLISLCNVSTNGQGNFSVYLPTW